MHIAMVTPFPAGKPKGGVQAAAVNLVREYVRLGHRVTVVAPSYLGETHAENREGFTLQWVSHPPMGFLSYWTVFRRRVHRVLAELKPDITHFQALLALSNGYRAPYVGTVHGIGEQDVLTRGGRMAGLRSMCVAYAEGKARRNIKNCIVINPYVAEMLGKDLQKAKLHSVANPLDPTFFTAVEQLPRRNDFLFVAKMDRNKNLMAAIEAFGKVKDKLPEDTRLLGVGPVADKNYHQTCLQAIEREQLGQQVEFLGMQPPEAIAEYMRCSRALLLTSQHEVAPMVISEALSCGLPTISFRKCGMQHMIQSGATGLLVDDGDIDGLAQGMLSLMGASVDMEKRCRKASKMYAPERVAAETISIYHKVLTGA